MDMSLGFIHRGTGVNSIYAFYLHHLFVLHSSYTVLVLDIYLLRLMCWTIIICSPRVGYLPIAAHVLDLNHMQSLLDIYLL